MGPRTVATGEARAGRPERNPWAPIPKELPAPSGAEECSTTGARVQQLNCLRPIRGGSTFSQNDHGFRPGRPGLHPWLLLRHNQFFGLGGTGILPVPDGLGGTGILPVPDGRDARTTRKINCDGALHSCAPSMKPGPSSAKGFDRSNLLSGFRDVESRPFNCYR